MPKEELAADLYFVDTLVSTKRRSSLKNMQENFMSVYKEATEAIQTENYERSTVRLLYIFYEAYFYNDVQDDINVILSHALEKASGKPMEDASEILYNAMDKIMEGDLEPDEDDLEDISGRSHRANTGYGSISARGNHEGAGRYAGCHDEGRYGRVYASGSGTSTEDDATGTWRTTITD